MRWIRFGVLILAAAITQTSLIHVLGVTRAGITPNLYLILLVYFAVHSAAVDAILASFAIGLTADLFGYTVGPQVVAFGLIGSAIAQLRQYLVMDHVLHQMAAVFAAGLLTGLLALPLYPIKGHPVPVDPWQAILWSPLYSALVSPILFLVADLAMRSGRKSRFGLP